MLIPRSIQFYALSVARNLVPKNARIVHHTTYAIPIADIVEILHKKVLCITKAFVVCLLIVFGQYGRMWIGMPKQCLEYSISPSNTNIVWQRVNGSIYILANEIAKDTHLLTHLLARVAQRFTDGITRGSDILPIINPHDYRICSYHRSSRQCVERQRLGRFGYRQW